MLSSDSQDKEVSVELTQLTTLDEATANTEGEDSKKTSSSHAAVEDCKTLVKNYAL